MEKARPLQKRGGDAARLSFAPLTTERWSDLERLFGPSGACAGCWCMWWRLARRDFEAGKGEPNRRALRAIVRGGTAAGILAYAGGGPVGWVAVEPRAAYARLGRARALAPVDDLPVWSITCLYVAKDWRRRGVTSALVDAAAKHAFRNGAPAVEAYPVVPRGKTAASFIYPGVLSTYLRCGFEVVARPSGARAIVRRGRRGTRRARTP